MTGRIKGPLRYNFQSEGSFLLFPERSVFPKSEGDGKRPGTTINVCSKGQYDGGEVLIPLAFGFVLYYLEEELY